MEAARPYGFATPASIFAVSVTRFRLFRVRELMRKMSIWRLVSVDMFAHICLCTSDGYGCSAFASNLHQLCNARVSTAGSS